MQDVPDGDPAGVGDPPERVRYCASCGARGDTSNQFCAACGATMGTPVAATVTAPVTPSVGQVFSGVKDQLRVQGIKTSTNVWLVVTGCGLVVIAAFFPWWSATNTIVGVSETEQGSLSGVGRFFAIALAFVVVSLAWPAFTQAALTRKRKIGLTIGVGVLTLFVLIVTATDPSYARSQGADNPQIAFGVVLAWIGVVVVWISVFRIWRSRAQAVSDG